MFFVLLFICAGGARSGYAAGPQAVVKGEVLESSCEVQFLDDDATPVSEYRVTVENQTTGALKNGGVYGLFPVSLVLSDCMGVANEDKYTQLVGVSVQGDTTPGNTFLFRGADGTENDADPTYGFAITTTDPGGSSIAWNPGGLIGKNGFLPSGKTVVNLLNNSAMGATTTIPFWLGMSCGSSSDCNNITATSGGSLRADIEFTFDYQ
ncbi:MULTISPECIES: hypothetical protein [Serratia]|uniref:hypothetical protein n=1 Tax=Serratia TaxID=613 RepID=UPI0021B7E1A5|nr:MULTISPECIES: hypothetical protein [Serratia]